MRSTLFLRALTLLLAAGSGSAQETMPLWSKGHMPNSKGLPMRDSIANERIYRVNEPCVYAFLPAANENTGCAVLICPGGGYERIAYISSGFQLAKWFNSIGVSAFVLKYRLPHSPDLLEREKGPLQDAQRAMRLIRANAKKWNIDTNKIGVQGTSAGGHLAASLGILRSNISAAGDSLDKYSYVPNFMMLLSPVITMGNYTHAGSRKFLLGDKPAEAMVKRQSLELMVDSLAPPAFMVHAFDDKAVPPQNSLQLYHSLLNKNVVSSLHLFPQGGHAIHLHNDGCSSDLWLPLCQAWLHEMKFIAGYKK